jgi:hypothetical protein
VVQPVAGLHCDDFAVLDDGISRPVVSFSAHDEGRQSQDFLPVDRLEMVIDYGPVTIGGKSYILPLHSVNVGSQRSLMRLENNWYESFWTWGPYMTLGALFKPGFCLSGLPQHSPHLFFH